MAGIQAEAKAAADIIEADDGQIGAAALRHAGSERQMRHELTEMTKAVPSAPGEAASRAAAAAPRRGLGYQRSP
jgi:hypothetical protein